VNHEGVTAAIAVSSRDRVLFNFTEADMRGAKLARSQGEGIPLSGKQHLDIDGTTATAKDHPVGDLYFQRLSPRACPS
jgi:hypothetical protein